MKKVLLIVIDACASRVIEPTINSGKLPNLQALVEVGSFNPNCISIFPSVTHAATASIATGSYPEVHGIAGSHWYSEENETPVYYSSDIWVIMSRGLDQFFEDFAAKLNHQWLQTDTIFQRVEHNGLQAACLNHIIFRGDVKHKLNMPQLLSLIPGIPSTEEIYGPSYLCLGDFIQTLPRPTDKNLNVPSDILHRFGFEDDYTAEILIQMAKDDAMPNFTLAYFPDNDDQSHTMGPDKAVTTLEHFDKRLGELFSVYGGVELLLEELCVVITGDHSQSDILPDEDNANIKLDEILADFSLSEPGQPWSGEDDLIICPNLRMAQIYFRHLTPLQFERVVSKLLAHTAVDQVVWRAELTDKKAIGYYVATAKHGELHFWVDADGGHMAVDQHRNAWSWQGDLSVVDGRVTTDKQLFFGDYPNAFERIKGGLECRNSGHLWVTAKPGYEFSISKTSIHANGGSHGSLHILDSTVPLIVAGKPSEVKIPVHPRIIDVASLCSSVLGVEC